MSQPLVITSDDTDEDQLTVAVEAFDAELYWMRRLGVDDIRCGRKGMICISVSEEKAVDSYNSMFECSIHLNHKQAIQLRDWLAANVPTPSD